MSSDPIVAEFQRLYQKRELAAYRAVSAIQTVVDFWEAEDFPSSIALLRKVRADYQKADREMDRFLEKHQLDTSKFKENTHGNKRSAA